ncbi:MAG: hypothetical protein ACU836_04440 [Gammaproteobacteria bacterium]
MGIYPHPPFRATKEKIAIYLFFAASIAIVALFKNDSIFLWLLSLQWCIQITRDVQDYWQAKRGWLAKADDAYIYLYNHKNKFAKCDLGNIERQIVRGHQSGINIIYKNGRVRSKQFPTLDDQQIDELIQFLNCSISAQ